MKVKDPDARIYYLRAIARLGCLRRRHQTFHLKIFPKRRVAVGHGSVVDSQLALDLHF